MAAVARTTPFISSNLRPSLVRTRVNSPMFANIFQRNAQTDANRKEKLVVLGSGWAGIKLVSDVDKKKYDLTVISPVNHFVMTPLLAGSAVGTLEFRCVTEPVLGRAKEAHYYEGSAESIDFGKKQIHCSGTSSGETQKFTVDYDKLVIACGGVINTFNTPGVEQHAFFLKTVRDAQKIRSRIIECFDHASKPGVSLEKQKQLLHFAVVGGGPTGIEFSAELNDFVNQEGRRLYPDVVDKVQMTVFDVAPKILNAFDAKLVEYTHERFKKMNIAIRTGTAIKAVHKDHIELKDNPEPIVPYGLLVWSTGLTARPLIANLEVTKDRTRRIVTDDRLRVVDKDGAIMPNVYALGDCATVKDKDLPPTAQVAKQKANYLYKALNKEGADVAAFTYKHMGSMAYVGGSRALAQLNSGNHTGFAPFLLWRAAYLNMTLSFRNKVLVPVNWVLTWLCGRDVSRFP